MPIPCSYKQLRVNKNTLSPLEAQDIGEMNVFMDSGQQYETLA